MSVEMQQLFFEEKNVFTNQWLTIIDPSYL